MFSVDHGLFCGATGTLCFWLPLPMDFSGRVDLLPLWLSPGNFQCSTCFFTQWSTICRGVNWEWILSGYLGKLIILNKSRHKRVWKIQSKLGHLVLYKVNTWLTKLFWVNQNENESPNASVGKYKAAGLINSLTFWTWIVGTHEFDTHLCRGWNVNLCHKHICHLLWGNKGCVHVLVDLT